MGLGIGVMYGWSRYHVRAAERALERFDLRTAYRQLECSRGKWPANKHVLLLLARTARRLEQYADAEKALSELARKYEDTAESELEWRLLGVQQGDLAGNEDRLKSLVDKGHPDTPLLLEALAKGYRVLARFGDMVAAMNILLDEQPKNAIGLALRGKGWEGLHQFDKALADYERGLEFAPECFEARLALALALSRLGRAHEATFHFEWLRRQAPTDAQMLLGLARCRFETHQLDDTGQILDALLDAHPDHVAGLTERGRLALWRGQSTQALTHLRSAVQRAPGNREAHRLLLACLEETGTSAEIEKCRRRLTELHAGDVSAAKTSLRFRESPREPALRYELGKWCLESGEEQAALRWLFSALRVDSRHGPTNHALAAHFDRTGQPKRAAQYRRLAE